MSDFAEARDLAHHELIAWATVLAAQAGSRHPTLARALDNLISAESSSHEAAKRYSAAAPMELPEARAQLDAAIEAFARAAESFLAVAGVATVLEDHEPEKFDA